MAGAGPGGHVHIPWYATGFRHDSLQAPLSEIAAVAMRYGATSYAVYRNRDDRYKYLQIAEFDDKMAFEKYWYGPEFTAFRAIHSSHYQVPVVYQWTDLVAYGKLGDEPEPEPEEAPPPVTAEAVEAD
jgi:quinol monooxygenase YgiN